MYNSVFINLLCTLEDTGSLSNSATFKLRIIHNGPYIQVQQSIAQVSTRVILRRVSYFRNPL